MDIEKILEESVAITLSIEEIRTGLPKLDNMTKQIKKDIDDFNNQLLKSKNDISHTIGDINQNVEKWQKSVIEEQNKLKEYVKKIQSGLNEIKKEKDFILKMTAEFPVDKIISDMNVIKNSIEEIKNEKNKQISILEKRLDELESKPSSKKNSNNKTIEKKKTIEDTVTLSDYTESKTIKYLYDKYKETDTPIIVRRVAGVPWTKNYVFWVERVENGTAYGKIFNNGIFNKKNSYPTNKAEYCLYGDINYINKILEFAKDNK